MKASWDHSRSATVGHRLAERARRSVEAHRNYRTKRREDLVWTAIEPGAVQAILDLSPQARATLVRLDAGTLLPWSLDTTAQEILVVEGNLQISVPGQADRVLERHGLAVRSHRDAGDLTACAAATPTTLYVREMLQPLTELTGPEALWWQAPRAPVHTVPAAGRRWRRTFEGVEILPLWGTAEITSMLVRFAPGAGVPDHHHAAHEDCLMLEGEMFLGDVLLRPGDYQLAPAGGGHFNETSDVGCTFFFHGAIDPVLIAPERPLNA